MRKPLHTDRVAQFTILNPCAKRWDELTGGGRKRHCETCQTPVHAIEQYSQEEWVQVWRENNGHVCGYLAGPARVEQRSRRAILIGALLTFVSPLMAQNGRVRIRVTDVTGAPVPNARVDVLDPNGAPAETEFADRSGESLWQGLPVGDISFQVVQMGFATSKVTVTILNGDEVKKDVTLELGSQGGAVRVEGELGPFGQSAPIGKTLQAASPTASAPRPKRHRWWLLGR